VLIVLKSRSLKLQEPSGPVQACTGTALPFYSAVRKFRIAIKYFVRVIKFVGMQFVFQ
jgi:hypothetical protein